MRKLKKLRLSKDLPGVNLYRRDKLNFVFRKPGLTSERVKTDPAFARTRSKAAAFAHASGIAGRLYKTLRPLLSPWLVKTGYKRLLGPILSETEKRRDPSLPRSTIYPPGWYAYNLTREIMNICIPPEHLTGDIDAPIGATHYKRWLMLAVVSIYTGHIQTRIYQDEIVYWVGRSGKKGLGADIKPVDIGPQLVLAVIGIRFLGPCADGLISFNHQKSDTMYVMACIKGCFDH